MSLTGKNNCRSSIEIDTLLVFDVENGEHIFGEIEDNRLIVTSEDDWFGVDSLMLTVAEADSEDNCDSAWLHLTVEENNDVNDIPNYPIPLCFTLYNASPNPFNAQTRIGYNLPQAGSVTLSVYDIAGRLVKTLVDEVMDSGRYSVVWDGGCLTSGVYLMKLRSKDVSVVRKVMLIR
ncbi:MAG: T9SS type A sorting domain-containing protein [Candidatus Hatepunaea meridiana]|nr:T9SS type A sorting domain-containing protein [Candidatus Hatepunaea meridiana]